MARCTDCKQDMLTAKSCKVTHYNDFADGVMRERIRYGANGEDASGRCHDCGVVEGGYHHPSCDWEVCPRCRGQALSCECLSDPDDPEVVEFAQKLAEWEAKQNLGRK